ncbi:hypothetical protein BB559_006640 [Furculomyces boomerangus]|uniref:Uncharacterized protein n=1 Tax=Furculomyces boomerangus TaxID=61424 RepID=A0A2T9Y1F9_9FUNG|nr:hypothetical protein BB559_006640 [Furculomyces boomerangus]
MGLNIFQVLMDMLYGMPIDKRFLGLMHKQWDQTHGVKLDNDSFGPIDYEKIIFPASLYVDYVRLYQHPDRIQLSCDPSNRPTAQYIMDHPRAYYNPNITSWSDTGYGIPSYDINKSCK